MLTRESG